MHNTITAFVRKIERHQELVSAGIADGSMIFNQAVKMLQYFKPIKFFVEDVYTAGFEEFIIFGSARLRNGSYVRALADSFLDVLASYSDLDPDDLGMEPWAEKESFVAEANILSRLERAEIICLEITSMIEEIVKGNLHGCQILSTTMKFTLLGQPEDIEVVFQRIHCRVELAMLHDIACWVVHGELVSDGLFIKATTVKGVDFEDTQSTTISDSSCSLSDKKHDQGSYYVVDASYLPVHMKYSLAQKILSMGQLLIILNEAPRDIKAAQMSLLSYLEHT